MPQSDANEPWSEPIDGAELARALITRKQQGELLDADILALLDDMERVGLTDTEAYKALDAHRPKSQP